MSTSTARVQLLKPDNIDAMNSGASALSGNYNKIDAAIGCQVVPTVASIVSPFAGKLAWETTNVQGMVYDGTTWKFAGLYTGPVGFRDGKTSQLQYQYPFAGGASQKIFDCTFNAVTGRVYLVHYSAFCKFPQLNGDAQGMMNHQFLWRQGSSTQVNDTVAETRYFPCADSTKGLGADMSSFFEFTPNVTGQVTIGWWWSGKPTGANDVAGAIIGIASCYTTMTVMDAG